MFLKDQPLACMHFNSNASLVSSTECYLLKIIKSKKQNFSGSIKKMNANQRHLTEPETGCNEIRPENQVIW